MPQRRARYGGWVNAHKILWANKPDPRVIRQHSDEKDFKRLTIPAQNLTFVTQNMRVQSRHTDAVKKGWKITWVFRRNKYTGVVRESPDGRIVVRDFTSS